jgi:hypothetical protein
MIRNEDRVVIETAQVKTLVLDAFPNPDSCAINHMRNGTH